MSGPGGLEIVLLRHGRPRVETGRLSAAGFRRWVAAYDGAGLDPASPPPPDALAQAGRQAYVVCSDLARSTESAAALGLAAIDLQGPQFRELGLPGAAWRYPRLPPAAWAVLFRLLWRAGYAGGAETYVEALARSRRCAEQLAGLAARHGRVLLVGHGALNWLLARQLKDMGWHGPRRPPGRHWAFAVYRRTGQAGTPSAG